jgi:acid phosphatase
MLFSRRFSSFHPAAKASLLALLVGSAVGCQIMDDGAGAAAASGSISKKSEGLSKINHFVVIYLENHSFDNLYGSFPGADGLANAREEAKTQVDENGKAYDTLPPPIDGAMGLTPMPNQPFPIGAIKCTAETPTPLGCAPGDSLFGPTNKMPDVNHNFFAEQDAINGGTMNRFVYANTITDESSGALAHSYYDTNELPVAQEAMKYTLCDHFFHAAFGGSYINHQWLIAARTPRYENAPEAIITKLDGEGHVVGGVKNELLVTPDGFAVSTLRPSSPPFVPGFEPSAENAKRRRSSIGHGTPGVGTTPSRRRNPKIS